MTPGAKRVLEDLVADEDCDLAQEGLAVYCGTRRTNVRVLKELLELVAVSITFGSGNGLLKEKGPTYFGINDTGRALLRRPELEDELRRALYATPRRPFSIRNDRIILI